uniref:Putative monolaris n=1 Tax=Rhipicephalus pulchellus TaxID=72859 RepID=L7LSP2_RHIPC
MRMLRFHFMESFIFIVITSIVAAGRPGNRNISRCDARSYRCHYPFECLCFWRIRLGSLQSSWYHYSSFTDECVPGAEMFNCNGFPTKPECQRRCNFSMASRARNKLT